MPTSSICRTPPKYKEKWEVRQLRTPLYSGVRNRGPSKTQLRKAMLFHRLLFEFTLVLALAFGRTRTSLPGCRSGSLHLSNTFFRIWARSASPPAISGCCRCNRRHGAQAAWSHWCPNGLRYLQTSRGRQELWPTPRVEARQCAWSLQQIVGLGQNTQFVS